jgi:pyruvate-formate lyase-activating enzyme
MATRILNNLRHLVKIRAPVQWRIPLIPHFSATQQNLARIASFLGQLGVSQAEILPYNPFALWKWESLSKRPPADLPAAGFTRAEEVYWQAFFSKCLQNS